MPNRRMCLCLSVARAGVEPAESPRFELGRFASLRTGLSLSVPDRIRSDVLLRDTPGERSAAPRGRVVFAVAQVGFEPTASLSLNQGGLPVAYRAVFEAGVKPARAALSPQTRSRAAMPLAYLGQ